MTITLRQTKGSELTFQELDDNFTDLDGRVTTLEGSGNTDNQMLTLVGNDLSISGGNTVDLSGLGGGIALTDLSVTVNAAGSANLAYDNTTGAFTYTPPDLSTYALSANITSDIDTHLNTGTATANQVLSWDGADYVWVADQTGAGGGIALTDLSVTSNAAGTAALAYDNTTGVFTYTPPLVPSSILDLGVLEGNNGEVLTTDGNGTFNFEPMYGNNDVDVHIRQTSANTNEILLWDGSSYQWEPLSYFGIQALQDVNFNSVTLDGSNGQGKVLAWDQTLTAFVPVDQSAGGGGASVTVQDDAPTSPAPTEGDLWWESDTGVLKIYYGGTWVDASPAGSSSAGVGTLQQVIDTGNTSTTTAVIPFYYANQAAFPNATTYHGAIAHSHADGSMFFAHSGSWNRLANIADLDFNTLTNQSDAYKVNIQSTSLAQDHYPLMHSDTTGTGITPLVDTEYRYNPDTNTLSVHNVTVLTELTAPAINPVTDTVGATGTELVINGGEATALNSQGGDLTLDAGAGAILPGEINLGVNSSNTGQVNIGYSGSAIVVDGRTTFNGDVTLTTGTWETVNTSITTGAATVIVDCDSGHIVYLDASAGAFNSTFTINLVNLGNTSNVATAVTVIIKQPTGAGVLPNAIQIGGTGQTLLWQGGSAPTPNAGGNAHDVFTFSVLDLGATNVVLGQMVDYA